MGALKALQISVPLTAWSSLALAQVTAPTNAPNPAPVAPAAWYDGYSWWWIVLVIIVVGSLIWWFTRSRGTRM